MFTIDIAAMRDLTNLGSHIIRCFTNPTIAGPGFGCVGVLGIATGPSEHLDAQMLSGGIVGGVRLSGPNPHDAATPSRIHWSPKGSELCAACRGHGAVHATAFSRRYSTLMFPSTARGA